MKCRRSGCEKQTKNMEQLYCSQDCAPYGHITVASYTQSVSPIETSFSQENGERSMESSQEKSRAKSDLKTGTGILLTGKKETSSTEKGTGETRSDTERAAVKSTMHLQMIKNVNGSKKETNEPEKKERNSMQRQELDTERSLTITDEPKESVENDETPLEGSLQPHSKYALEKCPSLSLIDSTVKQLHSLMESVAEDCKSQTKGEGVNLRVDPEKARVVVEISKSMTSMMRLKLDVIKEARI